MMIPIYYNKRIDEDADMYALVPVTMLNVVKTERKVDDDFIATAVKRFKKQDAGMSYMKIAEKLCQEPNLIRKIVVDIKDAEKSAKDVALGEERYRRAVAGSDKSDGRGADGETGLEDSGDIKTGAYVVFNHVTGVICRDAIMATDLKELPIKDFGDCFYKSKRLVLEPVGKNFDECYDLVKDGMIAPEVKRLLVDVDLDPEKRQYTVIDVYPVGNRICAYMAVSVKWTRVSLGKKQEDTVAFDNWSIGSIRSNGRSDIGMRDKIISDTNKRFSDFHKALKRRFDNLKKGFREYRSDQDKDMSSIDEIDKKYDLRMNADLQRLIWDRQKAITAVVMETAEQKKRGIYEKCYGVLEREIHGLLNRETDDVKNIIKDRVDNMRDAVKRQAIEKLFMDVGLEYKDAMYEYFASVSGKKIYGMFFEERLADLFTAIIALLIRYTMDKKYKPVERLKAEYPDFIVEFDNLDILNKRNKGKHDGQAFETAGVIRFAGKMEHALYGINIIEELGAVKTIDKPVADAVSLGSDAAERLGLGENTELRRRFMLAYASFLNSDSSFYADCENALVELYGGARVNGLGQDDMAKRNETAIKYLSKAGFDKTMLSDMPMLKSGTGMRLLAQKFLDMVADKHFIKILVENKQALRLANELYEDIGHSGNPFDIKRCAQYLELVETQIVEVSKFS